MSEIKQWVQQFDPPTQTRDCIHKQLARSCPICALELQVFDLTQRNELLQNALTQADNVHNTLMKVTGIPCLPSQMPRFLEEKLHNLHEQAAQACEIDNHYYDLLKLCAEKLECEPSHYSINAALDKMKGPREPMIGLA